MFEKIKQFYLRHPDLSLFGLFFVFLLLLLSKFLLAHGNIISHGDINAFYGQGHRLSDLSNYLFNDYGSLSNLENYNTALFIKSLMAALKLFGLLSSVNIYRLGVVVFFTLSYLSSYNFLRWFLVKKCKLDQTSWRLPIFLGALFYTFSPYVLNVFPAGGFWLAYAITPYFLLYLYQAIESDTLNPKSLAVLAILLSIFVIGTQYLFYSIFIGVIILIIEAVAKIRRGNPQVFWDFSKKTLWQLLILAGATVLLNLHWILPTLQIYASGNAVSPGYTLSRDMIQTLSGNANFLTTAISSDTWTQVNEHLLSFFTTYSAPALACRYLLVLLSLASLLTYKQIRNRQFFTLFFIFIFFWAFSIGLKNPLYGWLAFSSPLKSIGWIFRASSKLTYFLWFFYSIGFTVTCHFLLQLKLAKARQYLLVAGLLLLLALPVFNKFYSLFSFYYVPTQLPTEYTELYSFLDSQNKGGTEKALFLAPYWYGYDKNRFNFEDSYTWEPGKMAGGILEQSSPYPSIGYWHYTFRTWQNGLYQKIYPEFTSLDPNANIPSDIGSRYLEPANVRYLIFHNDVVGAQEAGSQTVQVLSTKTDLRLVKQFGSDIYVYENPNFGAAVTSDSIKIDSITKVNPTEYTFTINGSGTLHFAQAFDPFWQLRIGDKVISPVSDGDTNLIKYVIDEPYNGSVQITYLPQASYETGLKVSLSLFTVTLLYLVIAGYLQRKNNEI